MEQDAAPAALGHPTMDAMPGSRRRKAIAVLWLAQAVLFRWGCIVTAAFLVTRTGDPSLASQLSLLLKQAAGFAGTAVLAVFTLRGSPRAVYGSLVVAAFSTLIDVALAVIEVLWVGPLAFLYLLFFPLPNVPLGAVAIPSSSSR